jgi:integral membrane protein (TIGR01906 family)
VSDLNERSHEPDSQSETGLVVDQPDEQTPDSIGENYRTETVYKVLSWIVTFLIPVLLVLTSVRLVMTPVFVFLEYHTPNFPADPYGFTRQDRLYWSRIALDYLLNDQEIDYLGDLQFPDGSPVYNERELHHMLDVKIVAQDAIVIWYLSLAITFILGVWAWFGSWWGNFSHGLRRGGWLTLILVGVTLVIVLVGFGLFFVFFHDVFFDPGTWRFAFSDTLIRLFPERFWRDTFLVVALLTGAGGLILTMIFKQRLSD